jgi:hypothetical protein
VWSFVTSLSRNDAWGALTVGLGQGTGPHALPWSRPLSTSPLNVTHGAVLAIWTRPTIVARSPGALRITSGVVALPPRCSWTLPV